MTRIVLDIPNNNDVELLLPLLRRPSIIISTQNHELSESEVIYHKNIIEKGGRNIEHFGSFMQDFELSRQDRVLERLDTQLKTELETVIEQKSYTEDDFRQILTA